MKKNYISLAIIAVALFACTIKSELIESKQYSLSNAIHLSDNKKDSLYIELQIEFPQKAISHINLEAIQEKILQELFGEQYKQTSIEDAISLFQQELITEYKLDHQSIMDYGKETSEDLGEWDLSYTHELVSSIVFLNESIMSYCIERYVYMGGAHGINTRLFHTFDLASGQVLNQEDFFTKEGLNEISEILISCLIEQNNELQLISDVKAAGYETESIKPNNNFYISEQGITYVFNPYEIAPYVLGETEVFIASDKINSHIKPHWQTLFK